MTIVIMLIAFILKLHWTDSWRDDYYALNKCNQLWLNLHKFLVMVISEIKQIKKGPKWLKVCEQNYFPLESKIYFVYIYNTLQAMFGIENIIFVLMWLLFVKHHSTIWLSYCILLVLKMLLLLNYCYCYFIC